MRQKGMKKMMDIEKDEENTKKDLGQDRTDFLGEF